MFKTLAKSIREYKKPTILTPIIVLFEVIMECAIPFIVSQLFEELNKKSDLKIIALYGIILVVMALLSLTCGALAGKFCANASCGFAKNLRKDMFRKIQTYSFENIDKFQTSSLVTRLTTDVTNVQFSFMMLIRTAIRSPFMLIFSFTMGFIMGGKTALIYVFVIPILLFGLIMIAKKAMPLFRKVFKKYDNLNNSIQENIKGMRVVKSFVREDFEKQKFDVAATDVCQDFTKAERILAWNHPIMQFCLNSVMIFILTAGSYFIVKSKATEVNYYQLSALLTYGFQILMSLMMLSMIYVMLTMSAESAVRICEVLNEKSTITNPVDPVMEVKNGSIDFEHVDFKYGNSKIILKDVNLHISSGETIGIIGGTGSAKTTLIQLISRLYDVTDGEIKVSGIGINDIKRSSLRSLYGMVLQDTWLFSGTIEDNVKYGKMDATFEAVENACREAHADHFIKTLPDSYHMVINEEGNNVSQGQKQLLTIARVILADPKILILDEATSSVDTRTEEYIQKAMDKLMENRTSFIIAHRLSTIRNADLILVMDHGDIVEQGNHEELLKKNGFYAKLYNSQFEE